MDRSESSRLGNDSRLRRYDDLRDMIGDVENPTPIVALRHLVPGPDAALYVKLEWMNPFGSVKDRPAKYLLEGLEARGELGDRTIVEATSGNTGIGLAAMAALMDKDIVTTVPASIPAEKAVFLRMLGAELARTPADSTTGEHPMDVAFAMAERMVADSDDYVMPNQYDNEDNVKSHYETTGPEIWAQTEGRIRHFIAGVGTCGTITGVGRFLKERDPSIQVVAIEPPPGHHISGLKNLEETSVPGILDRSVIDETLYVDDESAAYAAKRLYREEALMVGSSAAAIIAGAVWHLKGREGIAVAIAPDSGQKAATYLEGILDAK
jgi:cysteine synthase